MKRKILFLFLFVVAVSYSYAKDYKISSPDGKIIVTVSPGSDLKWSVTYDGKDVISSAKAGMVLGDGRIPASGETVKKATPGKINQVLETVVAYKRSKINDNCNTLLIAFKSGLAIQFRAYNDGVTYRFETSMKDEITVRNEIADFQFPAGSKAWYPLEESFMSHNERIFIYSSLDTIGSKHLASLPALFKANGINVLVTEADIEDYPGLWIRGEGSGKITGVHPGYPDTEKLNRDRDLYVTKTKDYIAKTKGTRTFPWRAFVITLMTAS